MRQTSRPLGMTKALWQQVLGLQASQRASLCWIKTGALVSLVRGGIKQHGPPPAILSGVADVAVY